MAVLALPKDVQARLGRRSERSADIGRYRIRKLAIAQAKNEREYFANDSTPEQPNTDPQLFKKLTPIIEFAGTPSARSGVFLKWIDGDRNRCLILVQSGVGVGLVVISDRRCLSLQCQQLSLF